MPQARVVLSVLADEAEIPGGVSRAKLLDMPAADFLEHPELLDWLLPADNWFHPQSTAPRMDREQAQWLLGRNEVSGRLLEQYWKFASVHGLAVDHHGWVFNIGGHREDEKLLCEQLVSDPARGARALRFLKLTKLEGYSNSGVPVPDLSYSRGLRERLHAMRSAAYRDKPLPPHAWGMAVDE